MQKSSSSIVSILFLGVILLLVNAISSLGLSRFYVDLTEENLYTLSDGSKNILSNLQENIVLKTYISKTDASKYPAIKLYGDRVVSLLKEYVRKSNGKLKLEVYDPRPDTDEEIWAQKFGITPLSMPDGEKIYFGLAAINGRGDEEIMPVFSLTRQEFLEYDLSRLINSLSLEQKPVVGIISALNIKGGKNLNPEMQGMGGVEEPWVLLNQLSKIAEVKFLATDLETIDSAVKLLMLVHPKNLSPKALYAIDQFVLRGGNLFVALDPYCSIDQPEGPNSQMNFSYDKSSNLKELLATWGVDLIEKKVVGDINLSTRVATQRGVEPDDYIVWLNLQSSGNNLINKSDMLTSQLDNVLFPWAGALRSKNIENINFQPLFTSTQEAMLIDEADYKFNGGSPDALLNKFVKGNESYVLAARLSGKFKSNFKEKAKDEKTENNQNQENPAHLNESSGVSNIVVVADVDFMTDLASTVSQNILGTKLVTLINDNLAFMGNATENLLGSNDLISLRSRGRFTRPFTKVLDLEKKAELRYRNEEMAFQATLNSANQRLNQILGSGSDKSEKAEQAYNSALLDEIKAIREEKANAQEKLRQVRKNLRQDKESLGKILFIINTFAVPLALIILVIFWGRKRKKV